MTVAYVYKWTHLPTLKWYVGSRTARGCHPNDQYICSSRIVKPLIMANPEEWSRTIIDTGTPEQMRELEEEILHLFDAAKDNRSFNQHNGDGKFTTLGTAHLRGLPKPFDFGAKISRALKGRKKSKKCKDILAKYSFVKGQQSSFKGRRHSEETKKLMSETRKGRPGKPNFAGHKHFEESRNKISESLRGQNSKLTEDQVRDIRYNLSYKEAKLKYAGIISVSTIEAIRGRKTWKHI
jgi:hypothetical protein